MSATVIPLLYLKTGCPWCEEVLDYFNKKRMPYEKIVVSGNRQAMETMVALSGQSKAPTMDWQGDVLADFGVEELIPFLRERGVDA
jgi:glutaredoxin